MLQLGLGLGLGTGNGLNSIFSILKKVTKPLSCPPDLRPGLMSVDTAIDYIALGKSYITYDTAVLLVAT